MTSWKVKFGRKNFPLTEHKAKFMLPCFLAFHFTPITLPFSLYLCHFTSLEPFGRPTQSKREKHKAKTEIKRERERKRELGVNRTFWSHKEWFQAWTKGISCKGEGEEGVEGKREVLQEEERKEKTKDNQGNNRILFPSCWPKLLVNRSWTFMLWWCWILLDLVLLRCIRVDLAMYVLDLRFNVKKNAKENNVC
jgi:hypothetical protein